MISSCIVGFSRGESLRARRQAALRGLERDIITPDIVLVNWQL